MIRGAPLEQRSDVVTLARGVMRDLDALDVREAVSKEEQLRWIAKRLLLREAPEDKPLPEPREPSLEQYRALRAATERAPLSLVLSEVALVLEAKSGGEPRGAVTIARALLATLGEAEQRTVARIDLAALDEHLSFLESWLSEGRELGALMQVAFDESALLRCSLESQLLGELLPHMVEDARALEARVRALSASLQAIQTAYREKANDAAWNEALTRP